MLHVASTLGSGEVAAFIQFIPVATLFKERFKLQAKIFNGINALPSIKCSGMEKDQGKVIKSNVEQGSFLSNKLVQEKCIIATIQGISPGNDSPNHHGQDASGEGRYSN